MTELDQLKAEAIEDASEDLPIFRHLPPEEVARYKCQLATSSMAEIEQLDYITKQEEWLRESLRPFMPKSIFKSAYGPNKKRAARWLKSNGFQIIEDQARGGKFLYRGQELISSFTPKLHVYGKQPESEQSKPNAESGAPELANA